MFYIFGRIVQIWYKLDDSINQSIILPTRKANMIKGIGEFV